MGKDVSLQKDMSLPVSFCEPLADLQRRGEFMSYSELLDQARCCSFLHAALPHIPLRAGMIRRYW